MAEGMVVEKVELHAARPEAADVRKLEHLRAEGAAAIPDVSYIIKVYIQNLPPPGGSGYALYVGDREVRKYAQFKNGIFFKVTDPKLLASYRGKKIRFRRTPEGEFIETNVIFPAAAAERGLTEDARSRELPTQEEVLRE